MVGLLVALPITALAAGCGLAPGPAASNRPQVPGTEPATPAPPSTTDATPDATAGTARADTASPIAAPPADRPSPIVPDPAGGATVEASPVDGLVAGTDSSTPFAATPPTASLEARLVDFGLLYLAFDYRADPGAKLVALRPLVVPALLDQLAQPLPPALTELVEAERRVVEAEFVGLVPLASDTFQLTFTVATSSDGDRTEQLRTLTVTVNGEQLISDVR